MNLCGLQQLFTGIPHEMELVLGNTNFKTCWCSSMGFNSAPMLFADHSRPVAKHHDEIAVFFYTDIDFFIQNNSLFSSKLDSKIFFSQARGKSRLIKFNGECMEAPNNLLPGIRLAENVQLNNGPIHPQCIQQFTEQQQLLFMNKFAVREKFTKLYQVLDILAPYLNDAYNQPKEEELIMNWVEQGCLAYTDDPRPTLANYLHGYYPEDLMDITTYPYHAVLVKHFRANAEAFYTFYLDVDDLTFEQVMEHKQLHIDYKGSMEGDKPKLHKI